jgi:Leucine-rich repeat (LRR) protein
MAQADGVRNTEVKLNYYRSAIVAARDCHCSELEQSAYKQIDTLFRLIEAEKRKAEAQSKTILQQQNRIEVALIDAKEANVRNERIITSMDFYKEELALAFHNGKYGFIDKVGEPKIEFSYDKGEPFNQGNGLAKMEKGGVEYLIDVEENKYKLINISEILKDADNTESILYQEDIKWLESVLNNKTDVVFLFEEDLIDHQNKIEQDSILLEKEKNKKVKSYLVDKMQTEKEAFRLTKRKLKEYQENRQLEIGKQLDEVRIKLDTIEQNLKIANDRLFNLLRVGNERLALDFSAQYSLDIIGILEKIAGDKFISSKVEVLFLNETDLERIPSFISTFKNLKQLNLSRTKVETLPESFGELVELVRLDLSTSQLLALPNSIGNLSALKYLNLSETLIDDLPFSFSKLNNLEVLNLSLIGSIGSSIEYALELDGLKELYFPTVFDELPSSVFNLTNLEILDLSGVVMLPLPESIGQLHNLRVLEFPLFIDELPSSISNLKKLEKLALIMTSIDTLPESIGELHNLKVLDCPPSLKELPSSISNLKKLEALDLQYTKIKNVPESIGELPNLKKLGLPASSTEFPVSFSKLKNLEVLLLSSTKIRSLPKFVGDLQNLKRLSLPSTLEELPFKISKLKNLEILYFNMKGLKILPEEIGELLKLKDLSMPSSIEEFQESLFQLKNLERLSLSNTKIKVLPKGIEKFTKLKVLKLNNTSIDKLSEEVCKLVQLTDLDLEETKISNLPLNINKLVNLERLILKNTAIQKIPASIEQLINLEVLNIGENPSLKLFPDFLPKLRKLKIITYTLYHNENYNINLARLAVLQKKLPNCSFRITDEKGEDIYIK